MENFMYDFFRTNGFSSNQTVREQCRSIWTTYCLINDLIPDTGTYDNLIMEIYNSYCDIDCELYDDMNLDGDYTNFDLFDLYMSSNLV